ncbi:peptidoglycan/LPS O-acetylase OafA/YrhL [Chitinivorax tropicus]|uniref:Peptidoglycan/LPS O-acetylase OafA/YrhL n=1 Tax=Chitinivorax tropicus TaxID=714531 RepID=A0A840MQ61_9PROT|nr:acyltransferase [Chitinivorax tropicus]MBB5018892.1 peptidoglycan/LPS O-acetylase OafA/YrhL [Chitinivorax tropicus]
MSTTHAPLQPATRINVVEAARGLCAGYVVLAHVFQILGYKYSLLGAAPLLVDLASGYPHEAVLFFFLLSGFSIHYASMDRPLNHTAGVWHYLYLRLRRVYPIFLVAVAGIFGLYGLGLMLGVPHYQQIWQTLRWQDVLATVTFVADRVTACGRIATVLPTNPPFWSLSYEMFYYLLYPAFWWVSQRRSIWAMVWLGAGISVAAVVIGAWQCGHGSNVLGLYYVWCLGALVAEYKRRGLILPIPRPIVYVLPYLAMLVVWLIAQSRLVAFETPFWVTAFFVVLAYPVSQARSQLLSGWRKAMVLAVILGGWLAVVGLTQFKSVADNMLVFHQRLVLFSLIWLGLVISDGQPWRASFTRWLIERLYGLGGISYALYLIHYPALVWMREWTLHQGLAIHWGLTVIPLVLLAAWWLERWLQPRLVPWLDKAFKVLPTQKAAAAT